MVEIVGLVRWQNNVYKKGIQVLMFMTFKLKYMTILIYIQCLLRQLFTHEIIGHHVFPNDFFNAWRWEFCTYIFFVSTNSLLLITSTCQDSLPFQFTSNRGANLKHF
jgi:hypothetical protein